MDPHYIIGYKRGDDGKEYRYLANSNGKTVNAVNAKATADLGAGEQELDTATVVPEHTPVTVTAKMCIRDSSYHGHGAIENIVPELTARGYKKAFVCSDPDLIKFGVTKKRCV